MTGIMTMTSETYITERLVNSLRCLRCVYLYKLAENEKLHTLKDLLELEGMP